MPKNKRLCLCCSVLQGKEVYMTEKSFKDHLNKCEKKFKKDRGLK